MTVTERQSDPLVIAAWAGTIFGLLEGAVFCASRSFPLIQAAHKVSNEILWVAPVVDVTLFLLAAVALLLVRPLARRWLGRGYLNTVYGAFIVIGAYTVITAPSVINQVGAAVFSLGLAVVLCRRLRGWEIQVTQHLRRRLVWIPVLILAAGAGVAVYERGRELWLESALSPPAADAPSVLVVVLDTVRADRFSLAGETSLTPHLDRFAATGVRFENAWSTTSWSLPSQTSLLTGLYPHQHGADWPHARGKKQYPTLGEFLAARGYATGAFSGNAAWITPEYLGRGFLRFDAYVLEDLLRRTVHGRKLNRLLNWMGYHDAGRGQKAPALNAQLLEFLDHYADRPFFAYLCYMDVNQAFYARKFERGREQPASIRPAVEAYDAGLRRLDAQIGELLQALEERGRLHNTLVVLTSDHGQSFGAAETTDHDPDNHGTSLYSDQLQVPLFVVFPGKVPGGRRLARAVSIRSIPATITHLLGLADSPFPGEPLSLAWEQEGNQEGSDPCVLADLRGLDGSVLKQSVICERWQYIRNREEGSGMVEELYHLAADPLAKQNLAGTIEAAGMLERMRGQLQQLTEANGS